MVKSFYEAIFYQQSLVPRIQQLPQLDDLQKDNTKNWSILHHGLQSSSLRKFKRLLTWITIYRYGTWRTQNCVHRGALSRQMRDIRDCVRTHKFVRQGNPCTLLSKSFNTMGAELTNDLCIKRQNQLTHISLASFLWDTCKNYWPRSDATYSGFWSGSIMFACRMFI